jgi:hypothetical protein
MHIYENKCNYLNPSQRESHLVIVGVFSDIITSLVLGYTLQFHMGEIFGIDL